VNVRIWGTRGSLPTPGSATERYGGNTSCVEVRGPVPGHVVVLDAGSGIRPLGAGLESTVERIDVLLSHLHMDHIIGLGFFAPLFRPDLEIHLWGPSSPTLDLRDRLARYLSPPLFPVHLREVPCRLTLHDVPLGTFELPGLEITAQLVCHPGPTVGYRLDDGRGVLTYLPDHEPALGVRHFPGEPRWTSGFALAAGADVLVHDAQYDADEYSTHVGWGHSSVDHALDFAELAGVRELVAFHHDPTHDDRLLDAAFASSRIGDRPFVVTAAREGMTFEIAGTPTAQEAAG
jgi:phosphoribosyl 1,2-cyclic phosphodiesterase